MTDNLINHLMAPEEQQSLPTLNKPWEKPLQHLQATITGLNTSERNLRTVIDAMPPDLLLPGEMTVLEIEANRITDLIASLLKTHMKMARNIRKATTEEISQ